MIISEGIWTHPTCGVGSSQWDYYMYNNNNNNNSTEYELFRRELIQWTKLLQVFFFYKLNTIILPLL